MCVGRLTAACFTVWLVLTHFLHCRAFTWLKTTCHLEQKGTTLILFGINYVSHYPQMDKAVIFSGSCLGGDNIEDPQMWNNSNELRFINAKGNWLDGHGFFRVWLTERESERYPCGGGGGLNPTEQMPGLTILPCWFTCNQSNKHNSQEKRVPLFCGESRGVGRWELRALLFSCLCPITFM